MSEIERVIKILESGGVIVYPTDTLYALGANIFNRNAVERVYEIKRRPKDMPLSICIDSVESISKYAEVNEAGSRLIKKFMPGAITIILKKKPIIPDYISVDTVAIRVPANEVARKIASRFPVTATSANIHGEKAATKIEEIKNVMKDKVDMYIDGGELKGIESTIVDASKGKIKIIREGAIPEDELYV